MAVAGRRRKLLRRASPVVVLAAVAFGLGVLAGAGTGTPAAADRFAQAWTEGEIEAMYSELSPQAREQHPLERFERAYRRAARVATVESVSATVAGEAPGSPRAIALETAVDTRAFGRVSGRLDLPLEDDGIAWEPHLAFPGLEPGELLSRRTQAPQRAAILALDGSSLAEGPAGDRSVGEAAAAVVGSVGSPEPGIERQLEARGFPPGALVGQSGLELAYDEQLGGVPGGRLLAVEGVEAPPGEGRVLASSEPEQGDPVRTTIDPDVQEATVAALGGLYGGIAVLDAERGAVRALAGIAFTAPQPPGSTFKAVTAVAALDSGVVEPEDEFPVEVTNAEIGREIANAGDSACGGTFVESFARSCNTVFAPVGAEVGGETLVEVAEAFGFNSSPALHGPAATAAIDPPASTIPTELEGSVEIGVTALGQGELLATPLQMASVAQAIANDGIRMPTPMVRGDLAPDAEPERVTSRQTARALRRMMVAVVADGTGSAGDIPGVRVAGKTGTAELGPTALAPSGAPEAEPEQELNAWFIAFAPADSPQLAISVMIVDAGGDGGEIAAPIAREVLEAALG